jgi:hypothetical protein
MPAFRLQLSHETDELIEFEVGGRPATVSRYSVVLRHLDPAGNATAVRVYDNSHDPRERHMHRCDREGRRRQPPDGSSRVTLAMRPLVLARGGGGAPLAAAAAVRVNHEPG